MSPRNVELIEALIPTADTDVAPLFRDERLFEASKQALAPLLHPDFESVAVWQGGTTYAGVEGFREMWLDWLQPWATYYVEVEEVIDAGDRVVVLVRDRGRRHEMEAEVGLVSGSVWEVRDGRIARVQFCGDRGERLQRRGSESGLPAEAPNARDHRAGRALAPNQGHQLEACLLRVVRQPLERRDRLMKHRERHTRVLQSKAPDPPSHGPLVRGRVGAPHDETNSQGVIERHSRQLGGSRPDQGQVAGVESAPKPPVGPALDRHERMFARSALEHEPPPRWSCATAIPRADSVDRRTPFGRRRVAPDS